MRALLRRAQRPSGANPETFRVGDAEVNLTAHTITRAEQTHQISFYEVELLRLLFERVGQPVSRDEILQKIWGLDAAPSNRTVDNFIVKLRKKIERLPDKPERILTVYGYGYKLAP
jgi:DNA-binding response OmpR family regulator